MIRQVVAIPHAATVLEACEFFLLHKFLAFPVVDEQRRLTGVVEIGLFTDEVFDLAEREQSDAIFEAMGFRLAQVRDASPLTAFRYRFPWLLATIASGSLCALLASALRSHSGAEPGAGVFSDAGVGTGGKRQHPVDDGHDSSVACRAAESALVLAAVVARGPDVGVARARLGTDRRVDCLGVAWRAGWRAPSSAPGFCCLWCRPARSG